MDKSLSNITQNLNNSFPEAAQKLAAIPKVTPEVMMIVYLDEIAGRLAELQDAIAEITAEGEVKGHTVAVSDRAIMIPIMAKHISIRNNGDYSIYINQDKTSPDSTTAPLRKNATINIDFMTKRPRFIYLLCASGETATVDYFTW